MEEGEIIEESEVVQKPILDINEFIKRQEELKKRQDHKKSLQVSEQSKIAAELTSKQVKRRLESKSDKRSKKPKLKLEESDSDYEPSEDDDCCDGVVVSRRKGRSECTKIEKVKDDGSVTCYKLRLEQYYKQLEQEKALLNRNNEEEEEFFIVKGGLKVPVGVWNNLYRCVYIYCSFFVHMCLFAFFTVTSRME